MTPLPEAGPQSPCSLEGVEIKGGSFRLLKEGQVLEYLCPSGFYPYPVQIRTCRSTGSWSTLQTQDRKIVKRAECKGWRAVRMGMGRLWDRAGGSQGPDLNKSRLEWRPGRLKSWAEHGSELSEGWRWDGERRKGS